MNDSKYIGLKHNGFIWFAQHKGVHSFQKKSECGYRWELIQCTEEQLSNGDIEFMTQHGWTLSRDKVRESHKQYEKAQQKKQTITPKQIKP